MVSAISSWRRAHRVKRASRIAILGLAACLSTLAIANAQVVQLSPAAGHPGFTVNLTGSGFGTSEAVDLYVDITDTQLTVSSGTGTLSATLIIPASEQPGTHFVTAVGRHSGIAAQMAFNVTTGWTKQGYGAGHLSWNPYENTITPANVSTLGQLWSVPTSTLGSAPAVANGLVFVTTNSGIQALSTGTGAVSWSKLPGVQFYGSPAVDGGTVYAMSETGPTFYALKATSGATRWTQTLGGPSLSSPTVVNGIVYIPCNDGKVYALNATTGAILWSSAIGGTTAEASPAVVGNVLYVGSTTGTIYALNAVTGALIWSYTTGGSVEGSPSMANGVLYEGSDDGKVYALKTHEPSPGTLLWSVTTGSDVYQAPAVASGVVYIGSQDGHLYALDARTGAQRWVFAAGNILGSAVVANNVVYVTSRDGLLNALDANSGAVLASAAIGYSFLGNPAVSDGVVYMNAFGGGTYAFGLLGGADAARRAAIAPSIASLHPDMRLHVTP